MRLVGGIQGLMSYAWQRAKDVETDRRLVNSPAQMGKMRLSLPGPSRRSFLSAEVIALGSRQTLTRATLKPAATVGLSMVVPLPNGFELVGSARNLFDVDYADPASDSHRQDVIPQNGRTLRIGLRWKFGVK
jgi:iron complex outermembrane receptor protein